MARLNVCALAFAGSTLLVSAVAAETIQGTMAYADTNAQRPITLAKVEVWRFAPRTLNIWSWGADATVRTDINGFFSVDMPFSDPEVLYAVRVFATNDAAVVWPNDAAHTVPFFAEPGQPGPVRQLRAGSPTAVLDFSFTFSDSWIIQHYNIAETIRYGFEYAGARRDPAESDLIPRVNVQPTPIAPNSWYQPLPAIDTLIIRSEQTLEDMTILHEYAHFLEASIGSFAWIISSHNGCEAIGPRFPDQLVGNLNSPAHAWMEGFADYFAAVVASMNSGVIDSSLPAGTPSQSTLETQPQPCPTLPSGITSEAVEYHVAGSLWDLFDDGVNETFDALAGQDLFVFQIMDRELDGGPWPTIRAFHDAWVARGLDHARLDQILAGNGIQLHRAAAGGSPDPGVVCIRRCDEAAQQCRRVARVIEPGEEDPCEVAYRECQEGCPRE